MINKLTKIKLHTYHIALLLFVGVTLGSIGVGVLVQNNPLITSSDKHFYHLIHHQLQNEFLEEIIEPFNFNFLPDFLSPGKLPSYLYFMVLGTLIYLGFKNRYQIPWAIFCFVFGVILAIFITFLDWHFVFRPRPFITLENSVDDIGRQAWEKLSSYPSGHARETTLIATIMGGFIPFIRFPLFLFVLFIAFSRVYIGAHYPSDAVAGALIGFITGVVSLMVTRELQSIFKKRNKKEVNGEEKIA